MRVWWRTSCRRGLGLVIRGRGGRFLGVGLFQHVLWHAGEVGSFLGFEFGELRVPLFSDGEEAGVVWGPVLGGVHSV